MKNIDKDKAFTPLKAETLATINGGTATWTASKWGTQANQAWRWWQ